ncbi:MAG TPA: DNA gyrase C-terminal beta-propeller domain-containing protein, partial [Candidatus Dormibacteraeota bacterium]|nr:DNA gyrase C-terminal beta-propeller domain-containing protein [Candidatus Dormibacteraeota bacterium]
LGAARVEADFVEHLVISSTHSDMLFFTSHGSVYRLRVHEIPDVSRQAKGLPIANLIDIDPKDKITAVVGITDWAEDQYLMMVTKQGTIKKTPARLYSQVRRNGLIAIDLAEGDELNWVKLSSGSDELLIATSDGKAIRFSEKEVRPMGRDTQGVRGIRLREGGVVAGFDIVRKTAHVLVVSSRGYGKLTPIEEYPSHGRGGQGVYTMDVTDRTGPLVGMRVVTNREEEQLIVISEGGQVIRIPVEAIRVAGRQTQGVRGIRLREGGVVAGFDIVRKKAHVLVVSSRGYGKLTPIEEYPSHGRGGQGVYTMDVTDRTGPLVGMRVVTNREEEQLIVISEGGQVIRIPVEAIRVAGRQTQGVIIMRLDEGDTVATIAGVGGAEEITD